MKKHTQKEVTAKATKNRYNLDFGLLPLNQLYKVGKPKVTKQVKATAKRSKKK